MIIVLMTNVCGQYMNQVIDIFTKLCQNHEVGIEYIAGTTMYVCMCVCVCVYNSTCMHMHAYV